MRHVLREMSEGRGALRRARGRGGAHGGAGDRGGTHAGGPNGGAGAGWKRRGKGDAEDVARRDRVPDEARRGSRGRWPGRLPGSNSPRPSSRLRVLRHDRSLGLRNSPDRRPGPRPRELSWGVTVGSAEIRDPVAPEPQPRPRGEHTGASSARAGREREDGLRVREAARAGARARRWSSGQGGGEGRGVSEKMVFGSGRRRGPGREREDGLRVREAARAGREREDGLRVREATRAGAREDDSRAGEAAGARAGASFAGGSGCENGLALGTDRRPGRRGQRSCGAVGTRGVGMDRRGLDAVVQGRPGPDLGGADRHRPKRAPEDGGRGACPASSAARVNDRVEAPSAATKGEDCLSRAGAPATGPATLAAYPSGPGRPVRGASGRSARGVGQVPGRPVRGVSGRAARSVGQPGATGPESRRGPACGGASLGGALGRIRTYDPRFRRPMLYPTELRVRALQGCRGRGI